jgi:hypothetical protein
MFTHFVFQISEPQEDEYSDCNLLGYDVMRAETDVCRHLRVADVKTEQLVAEAGESR